MLFMMMRFGDHERHGGERDEQRQSGCDQRMALNAEPGDQKAANAAADKAAKAPETVRGRHDRLVHPRLNLNRIGVHRHIHRAEARAKKDERRDGERDGRRQHNQREGGADDNGETDDDLLRSIMIDQPARPRHGRHRPDADQKDEQAKRELGDIVTRQHERDLRRPGAHEEAVDHEHGRHGPAGAGGICLSFQGGCSHYDIPFCAVKRGQFSFFRFRISRPFQDQNPPRPPDNRIRRWARPNRPPQCQASR